MLLRAAEVLIENLSDPDEAMTLCRRAQENYERKARPAALRHAQIGLGDVWRARGNFDKAKQAYDVADIIDKRAKQHPAVVRGDFARQAEAYLRQRDYTTTREALDAWEETFPTDKLEGYSSLLRVEMFLAEKQYTPAAREAETLVKVNPQSPYAPDLLMQAYEAYHAEGNTQAAKRTLQRLAEKYKESPLARKAERLLKGKR